MSYSPFRVVVVILLIAVNGFFAAAEVALLSVRHSRLRQMAAEGQAGAQAALNLLANPGRLLSVTQVGVTLASLGLGWAGEDTLYKILTGWLPAPLTAGTAELAHSAALVLSFLIISYFHVVLGEVAPKNLAISKADRLAALVAPALLLFYRISLPFVVAIERSAGAITRAMRLRQVAHPGGHSAEELKLIVSSSRGLGFLPETQEDMIHRVLDLDAISVREIMTPRNDIVSISSDATLDQVLQTIIEQRHSRLPVYEGAAPEKIVGILRYKDLLPVWEERRQAIRSGRPSRAFRVTRLLRPHMIAPETKPLSQMLEEFRQGRSHMAMVVDEFGTITGMVTVEDVLEQLVGRIEDEHDVKTARAADAQEVELDGATRIRDLEPEYGIAIPAEAGFETLAGFLLYRLGEIPRPGQSVEYDGRRYTVLEMDRRRIARVRIEKIPEQPVPGPG
ncbi:MAG: hemolysin family protein [Acidobacteriia bacterium]|nr:hemolysin family protein [Terriglobia bacterium]